MSLHVCVADLHVHTCLSPCAAMEMSPRRIVKQAQAVGLDLIAICDHNAVGNAVAVAKAAAGTPLFVVPGIEVTTQEEVHLLGLFPDQNSALVFEADVLNRLDRLNDEGLFGYQVLADADDTVIGFHPAMLASAADISLDQAVDLIHAAGGLAIAAHVDREAFSIMSGLGFIPPELPLDAIEIAPQGSDRLRIGIQQSNTPLPKVRGSDAHHLHAVGTNVTLFRTHEATFEGLKDAIAGKRGALILEAD